MIIGDSISNGFGNLGVNLSCQGTCDNQDNTQAYGTVAARLLGADVQVIAWSGKGMYRNSDNTTTGTMPQLWLRTVADNNNYVYDQSQYIPDVVVINLATNDFAGGDPTVAFENTYIQFLQTLRSAYPQATILCGVAPMLTGAYLTIARGYIQDAISNRNNAGDSMVSFIELGTQTLNPDGSGVGCANHPTTATDLVMAKNIVNKVHDILGW